MVKVIGIELAQKLFNIMKDNVIVELYNKDKELFVGLRPNNKKDYFYTELLEVYDSKESLEDAAKVLEETFICKYIGDGK